MLPVAQTAKPDIRPEHAAPKHLLERPRRHLAALLKAQRRRPPAVPAARAAVLRLLRARLRLVLVPARVVAALVPEILRRGGRRLRLRTVATIDCRR